LSLLSSFRPRLLTLYIKLRQVVFEGPGDLSTQREFAVKNIPFFGMPHDLNNNSCQFVFSLYTSDAGNTNTSALPLIYAIVTAVIFFLIAIAFVTYDCFVQRRSKKLTESAVRSYDLVASLFPKAVREQMSASTKIPNSKTIAATDALDVDGNDILSSRPMADLYPNTTILFADLPGFMAWSSAREPVQIFILLETLYKAYDEIARRRGVFKVETIGDCYVAVTGLPEPQADHAVIMARFARECMHKTSELVKILEMTLGPDTAELSMKVGMHSGPVTGGVLRGEKSRFQLFGDVSCLFCRTFTTS
jgi:class 3 adenylate cyclase